MALLAAAIVLTAGLQRSISSSPNFWDRDRGRRIAGRLAATASMLVWCGVLFAGRWIHSSELPDPSRWLQGHEILLTTGFDAPEM